MEWVGDTRAPGGTLETLTQDFRCELSATDSGLLGNTEVWPSVQTLCGPRQVIIFYPQEELLPPHSTFSTDAAAIAWNIITEQCVVSSWPYYLRPC
jgi:hypothetical protein